MWWYPGPASVEISGQRSGRVEALVRHRLTPDSGTLNLNLSLGVEDQVAGIEPLQERIRCRQASSVAEHPRGGA